MFFHLPVRVTRSRHCLRHLNFEVTGRSELSCLLLSGHNIRCVSCSPACFLAALCHVLPSPCHACQTTTRSRFSGCHHSPDWRDLVAHRNRGTCQWRTTSLQFRSQLVQVDSDTVPHQLSESFPTRHKKNFTKTGTHPTKKLTTPTLQTTLQSVICGDSEHTP